MHPVHVEVVGQVVEIDIAGFGDRGAQVHRAVNAAAPLARDAPAVGQVVDAGTEFRLIRGHDAIGQSRHPQHRLDRRAGRIDAAQRAIEQRQVDVGFQFAIFGAA